MSIGARIVRPVPLQEIDNAPHAQASAQSHNEGLQGSDGGSEKLHKNLHFLRGRSPGHEKSRPCQAARLPLDTVSRAIQKRPGRPGRHS